MTKKIIFSITMLLLTVVTAMAVPAQQGDIPVQQPDGSVLNIRLYGDEYFNYATTEDGYLISSEMAGEWQYAEWQNNKPVATGIKANNIDQRKAADLTVINRVGKFQMSASEVTARSKSARSVKSAPQQRVGEPLIVPRGIVIMVNFSDVKFQSENNHTKFDRMLNEEGYSDEGSIGSVNDYFVDMSYEKYDPQFDLFGPVQLDNNRAYYDSRTREMVAEALSKMVDANTSLDMSVYDQNGDGFIDNVFIYFAGYNEAEGGPKESIWPHKAEVTVATSGAWPITHKGLTLKDYACTSELKGGMGEIVCGIGTYCHEFSHVLGLPDVYDTSKSHGGKTSGYWDIMDQGPYCGGGYIPCAYTAYERFFMNWSKPTLLNESGVYELENINNNDSASYIMTSTGVHNMDGANPNSPFFYTLETRVQEGWDVGTPGSGMIVSYIKFNKSTWETNSPNNNISSLGIDIIEADGKSTGGSKPGDAFPGTANVTSFTDVADYPINNIAYDTVNGVVTFSFGKMHTVTFEAGDFGTAEVDSLTETAIGGGVELPGVTANDTYTFEGWSQQRSAHIVDAGLEGERFYPSTSMKVYAVYTDVNGDTVQGNGGCFYETFNGAYDNEGWSGNITLQDGAANISGTATTPELNISGFAKVAVRARCINGRGNINFEVIGQGSMNPATTGTVYTSYSVYELYLKNCDFTTKLKISASVNDFAIDSIDICLTDPTSTEIIENHDVAVVNNEFISGLESGDVVNCIDMNGRALWIEEANENVMYFTAPRGVYMITVLREGKLITIKNVNI